MIISSDGTLKTFVTEDDGTTFIHHVEDTTAIAEKAKFLRDNTDRGFTHDRQMQLIGYIPLTQFFAEGLHKRDHQEAVKFLETSDKMKPYRVSERNTGHSGRIIIK